MYDEEVKRFRDALEEACHRSRRSRRDLERALGVANGYLSHLFSGRLELKVRHVYQILGELGLDPEKFFREAFAAPGTQPEAAPPPPASALPPAAAPRPASPPTHDLVRDLVRELVRQELSALLAERPQGTAPAP